MSLMTLNRDLPVHEVKAFGLESGGSRGDKSDSLDALSKFIPTEMLAPYVAFLAYASQNDALSPESIYLWFVVATPIVALFFQYAKSAKNDMPWPDLRAVIWRSIAATVAFAVWALAPPGSAYQAGVGGPAVAGLVAVIISPILTGADAIVLKLLRINREA